MKKTMFFAAIAAVLCACTNDASEVMDDVETEQVTLTFSPYDVSPMTRTATSISNYCTHLDVWITDGTTEVSAHQTSADTGFGTISVTLDKTKTYTMYAVAHKADGATLADGVISFTDDKVTHSMYYTTTFSPATTTNLSCTMTRIVADFRMEITDEIPAAVKKLRFTVSGVFDRWSVTDGGTHSLDRTSIINYNGTSAVFNIYAIVTDASTTHDITVAALDENDQEVQTRTFADVPLRNGYKTTYAGAFFTSVSSTATFLVDDWSTFDTVNF